MLALAQGLEQCEERRGSEPAGLRHGKVKRRSGREVAVVGAGTAGMACALHLGLLGHDVVLYEARARARLLASSAPLARPMMEALGQLVAARQVRCVFGHKLGENLHLPELQLWHDAVFLGIGLAAARVLELSGDHPPALRDSGALMTVPAGALPPAVAPASHLLVLGYPPAALKLALRARQMGVTDVTLALRQGLPGDSAEWALAHAGHVRVRGWLAPLELVAGDGGAAPQAVRFEQTRVQDGVLTRTGGFTDIVANAVCKVVGGSWGQPAVAAHGDDRIVVDRQFRTCQPGVYAGGDCTASWLDAEQACQQGMAAAAAIDADLRA